MQAFAPAGPPTRRSRRTGEASLKRALLQPALELQNSASSQWSQKWKCRFIAACRWKL